MLHSKATAALLRLKEMDRKYNIKRNEGKRVHNNISTESSPEGSPRVLQVNSKPLNNKYKSEDPILPIILAEKEIKSKVWLQFGILFKMINENVQGHTRYI